MICVFTINNDESTDTKYLNIYWMRHEEYSKILTYSSTISRVSKCNITASILEIDSPPRIGAKVIKFVKL